MREAFLANLADDSVIFHPRPVNGKKWWNEQSVRPGVLSWRPSFAFVSRAGDLGYLDPATVDPDRAHLARLHLIPADRLDDDKLVALFRRARRMLIGRALERAARAMIEGPAILERDEVQAIRVYGDLAMVEAAVGD